MKLNTINALQNVKKPAHVQQKHGQIIYLIRLCTLLPGTSFRKYLQQLF